MAYDATQYVQAVQQAKIQIINQTMNMNGMTEADLEMKMKKVRLDCYHRLMNNPFINQIVEVSRHIAIRTNVCC